MALSGWVSKSKISQFHKISNKQISSTELEILGLECGVVGGVELEAAAASSGNFSVVLGVCPAGVTGALDKFKLNQLLSGWCYGPLIFTNRKPMISLC